MKKKPVSFFISYARKNKDAMKKFLELFIEQTSAAKNFEYSFWSDQDLFVGDDWDKTIKAAINENDFGLLLVSPAFLGSQYIKKVELPNYLGGSGKRCFPVMLAQIDFKRHDLRGLDAKQIFMFNRPTFDAPRSFNELKSIRKEEFARVLFAQIDDWLLGNLK